MATIIATVSDLHAGSTVAAMPPSITLDDGGTFSASPAQLWLWQCWHDYWLEVERVRNLMGAKLYIIFNGDLQDGDHHNTSQILSRNPEAQGAVLRGMMEAPLSLKPDRLFFVRGTEAHVGKSGCSEEGTARRLRDDGMPVVSDIDAGTASWFHLRMEVDGVFIDVAHHGRTGQREHTRGNAANLYAHDILMSHVKAKDRIPDLCFRGHHHRFNDSGDMCPVRVVTTGAWQLATSWVHAKFADTLADIGGCITVVNDGTYDVRKINFKVQRGSIWKESA